MLSEIKRESDDRLIQACRTGDAQAWDVVMEKYERLVFSIPLNYGLSREDAADIAQYTFTHLIQSLDTFQANSNLGAWLATVARRATWRALRRTQREDTAGFEELIDQEAQPQVHDQFERWAQIEWLNTGLTLLNERCRDLLLALYFAPQEPSYAEIAARMGMSVGSIGPTRARCLERLKRLLGDR